MGTIIGVGRSQVGAERLSIFPLRPRSGKRFKRLQRLRHGVGVVLPDRYAELRRKPIVLKGSQARLIEQQNPRSFAGQLRITSGILVDIARAADVTRCC